VVHGTARDSPPVIHAAAAGHLHHRLRGGEPDGRQRAPKASAKHAARICSLTKSKRRALRPGDGGLLACPGRGHTYGRGGAVRAQDADACSRGWGAGLRAAGFFDALAGRLKGRLVTAADADYEPARRVFNGMIDRRPLALARCAGIDDVRTALDFAREQDLQAAVRGGGHNVAGNAVCDGGLVIDLSEMRRVDVDPRQRRALAEGGATWGISTQPARSTAWPPRAGSYPRPASPASPSAAASVCFAGCTG
jgi:hypothetical protein